MPQTSTDILRKARRQRAGIMVRLYVSEAIPTVRVKPDGAFAPAIFRTHLHIGTHYMRTN
jgi:hypothetical protein